MSIEVTIKVPDVLAPQIQRYRERLPEALELGLREVAAEQLSESADENSVISLLASQPSPEQVLAVRPTSQFQARVDALLIRNQASQLSRQEEAELERALTLEHLVRLAKAHAWEQLARGHDHTC